MTAEDLLKRTLRYLQKTDSLNVLAEDIEKYLAEPRKPMTEEEIEDQLTDQYSGTYFGSVLEGVRMAERHHGIGGGDND